ncbi:MAG: CDP-alcohol phosphatidyltransferase family protein [Gammaproteobacteria bacterium]|nr:CDP-alcohol phosphatidyltransferase family protein [Gammaproteobacteria bacterium]MDH5650976.1 CDP-alcohol phosphatidyltransferase family protein [Gammaproteobacteria bacterium]
MKARDIPNIISFIRILLVAPTAYMLATEEYALAFFMFGVAGATDAADGILARRFNWQSKLGALLDPIGDKLLLVSSFLILGWLGHLPSALVMLVIARDLIIVLGAASYHLFIAKVEIETVYISRVNTAFQMLLVVLVIFELSNLPLSQLIHHVLLDLLIVAVYISTILSGAVYVREWSKRAMAANKSEGQHD